MSQGISAQGTLIFYTGTTTSNVRTKIGELKNITEPPRTRKAIELTNHDDLDDSYAIGIRRKGELSWDVNYIPAIDSTLDKIYDTGELGLWEVVHPDNAVDANKSKIMFSGYLTNIGPKEPVDGALEAAISVRPTGPSLRVNFAT